MRETNDIELLRRYVDQNSEEAFAALVTRHLNLVYSVALRHVHNPVYAEEITQAVFVILARKPSHLSRSVVLSGWLYHAARLTAANFLRSETQRARREQEAYMQSSLNESEPDVWPQLAPILDAASLRQRTNLTKTGHHSFLGENHKDDLRDILSIVGIAGISQRDGINKVDVLMHQSGKRRFGIAVKVFPQ
jgi:RNA polymerase sigma factor (sigma-70 family)